MTWWRDETGCCLSINDTHDQTTTHRCRCCYSYLSFSLSLSSRGEKYMYKTKWMKLWKSFVIKQKTNELFYLFVCFVCLYVFCFRLQFNYSTNWIGVWWMMSKYYTILYYTKLQLLFVFVGWLTTFITDDTGDNNNRDIFITWMMDDWVRYEGMFE